MADTRRGIFASTQCRHVHAISRAVCALSKTRLLVRRDAKTSYLPARLLEDTASQMKKKGRLQAGMDADIIVFDPAKGQDRATY
jgi:N-acyl-D-aspartate/D-glutamate deacylase